MRVSPPSPPPYLSKDRTLYGVKGFTAGSKAMIIGPSSYYGVELDDHLSGGAILVCFPRVAQRGEGKQADEKYLPVEERYSGEREQIRTFHPPVR